MKAWKITTEDFRLIQVLEISFISMFLDKKIFGGIMKYQVGSLLFEAVEVSLCYFFENWLQMSKYHNLMYL